MTTISIYNKLNGTILRAYSGSVEDIPLQYNPETEGYVDGLYLPQSFYILNGIPVVIPAKPNDYSIFKYDTKQWVDPRTAVTQWPIIRAQRDQLLAASDWTQLPDVPLTTKTVWATYRQQLRDITTQLDPFNITWPQAPGI